MREQRVAARFTIMLVATLGDFACGGGAPSALCVPGEQKACGCVGGGQGAQTCNATGSGYDACEGCSGPDMNMSLPFDMGFDSMASSNGDMATDAEMNARGDAAIACTPGKSFCIANQVWQCTLSGTDGTLKQTCDPAPYEATTNNPYTCFEDCSSKGISTSPCCAFIKPRCRVMSTSDPNLNFTTYSFPGPFSLPPGGSCEFGARSCTAGDAGSGRIPTFSASGGSTASSVSLDLDLDPAKISPGQTKNLSDLTSPCAIVSQVSVTQGGTNCSHWIGTVTWTSGPPSFSISFNLTCTEMGKLGVTFIATFTGDQ